MELAETKIKQKLAQKFYCSFCDYNTNRKYNFNIHKSTAYHKNMVFGNQTELAETKTSNFACIFCEKKYKNRSGLWKHNKTCLKQNPNDYLTNINADKDLILMLIKQNGELKDAMIEQNKNIIEICKNNSTIGSYNTYSQTNNNSNNKTFNLQFFLNETCKDAMNIMDFVDSVKIQLSDLEKVGNIGYIDGISNIIIKNLRVLDVEKRPVHCTDSKREVLYIKDDNKWEKEKQENTKIRKVIKHIAHKNSKLINNFKEKYPDCNKSYSKKSDQYNKLIIEAMGGPGDDDFEKENKIITNVAKEILIDKEKYSIN